MTVPGVELDEVPAVAAEEADETMAALSGPADPACVRDAERRSLTSRVSSVRPSSAPNAGSRW